MRHLDACPENYFQCAASVLPHRRYPLCWSREDRRNTGSFTMNFRSIFAASAALLLSSAAANAAQVAALIGGDTIAMVDTGQKKATGSVKVTGISGGLVGIDVRPADGMLYGLVDDGTIVTIAMDGKATMKSKLDTMLAKGVAATVDFNPVADRLRVMGGACNGSLPGAARVPDCSVDSVKQGLLLQWFPEAGN